MRLRRLSRPLSAVVCAVVLSACGGGDPGPDDAASPEEAVTGADGSEATPGAGAGATDAATAPSTPTETADGEPLGPLEPSEPFGLAELTLRGPDDAATTVPVYVAATPDSRQRGLMFREELAAEAGMVFLFPEDNLGGFWMANTLIPLSIAFYDADGTVVSVLDMEPCTEEDLNDCPSYDPGVAYRGALEVNQGFFDEIGLTEGWTVELPEDVPDAT